MVANFVCLFFFLVLNSLIIVLVSSRRNGRGAGASTTGVQKNWPGTDVWPCFFPILFIFSSESDFRFFLSFSYSGLCAQLWLSSFTAAKHLAPSWVGGKGVRGAAPRYFFDVFCTFLKINFWSVKTGFL